MAKGGVVRAMTETGGTGDSRCRIEEYGGYLMKRTSVRGAILGVVAFVALLAFGSAVASAAEGAAAGWYWQNPLTQGNSLLDVSVVGGHVVAVGDAGSVFTSDDGGSSWTRQVSGLRGATLSSVDFVSSSVGWTAGRGGIFRTDDGGVSWDRQNAPDLGKYVYSSVSFVDASHGWACGSYAVDGSTRACRILRTTNGGSTWAVAAEWMSDATSAKMQFLRQVDFIVISPTRGRWLVDGRHSLSSPELVAFANERRRRRDLAPFEGV